MEQRGHRTGDAEASQAVGGNFGIRAGAIMEKPLFVSSCPWVGARDAKFVWVLAGKTLVVLLIAHCAILKKLSHGNLFVMDVKPY